MGRRLALSQRHLRPARRRLAADVDEMADGALVARDGPAATRSTSFGRASGGISPERCTGRWSRTSGPADLGDHDGGFEFRTTDVPARHFLWSQVAWVEIGATAAQEPPQALALVNGWVDFGGGYAPGAYLRDSNGWVHLRGMIANGAVTAGTVLATLPAGYRPAAVELFNGIASGVVCIIQVDAFGNVGIPAAVASNLYISLSGISFATHG